MRGFFAGLIVGAAVTTAFFFVLGRSPEPAAPRAPPVPSSVDPAEARRPAPPRAPRLDPAAQPVETLAAPEVPRPPDTTAPGSIAGTIRVPDDFLWTTLYVYLIAATGDPATPIEQCGRHVATSAPNRAFRFDDVQPGTYRLGAGIPMARALVTTEVTVGAGETRADLTLPAPRPEDVVLVRILGPDRAPLDDVDVGLRYDGARGFAFSGSVAARESPGLYRVALLRDEVAVERARVEVAWRGHWLKRVEFRPGRDAEVLVQFEAAAEAEITVEGLPKAMRGRVGVVLSPAGDGEDVEGPFPPGTTTDTWEFGPLDAGPYTARVVVGKTRSDASSRIVARRAVDLRSGPNAFTIVFPPLFDLELATEDGDGGAVNVVGADVGTPWATVVSVQLDDNGRGAVRDLAAGRYLVELLRDDGDPAAEVVVEVPAAGPCVLRRQRVDCFVVRVTDPDSVLARAGLEDGDRIVKLGDGAAFTTYVSGASLLRRAVRRGRSSATIRRGGGEVTIDLALPPSLLSGTASLGGSISYGSQE